MPTDQQLEQIMEVGKQYSPALLPPNIPRGKMGRCYDNCLSLAVMHPELRYVEGVAFTPHGEREWILHAWLTDGEHAYDPTWMTLDKEGKEREMPTLYFGIEMETKAVAKFVITTEYAGVIANAWRNPELANKAAGVQIKGSSAER